MSSIKLGLVKVPFIINHAIQNYRYTGLTGGGTSTKKNTRETVVSEEHNIGNGDIVLNLTISPSKLNLHFQLRRVSQTAEEVDICNCSAAILTSDGELKITAPMTSRTFISTDADETVCIETLYDGIRKPKMYSEFFNNSSTDRSVRVQVSGIAYYQKSGEGTLSGNLKLLVNNPDSTDVKFLVGDEVLYAHSTILIARSPVFKNMLSVKCSESSEGLEKIEDTEPETFREFLNFLYTDTCPNLSNSAFGLLTLATKYDVPALKEICECELPVEAAVNVENVCDFLFDSCDTIIEKEERDLLLTFTSNSIESVIETEGWKTRKEEAQGVLLMLMELIERIAKRVGAN